MYCRDFPSVFAAVASELDACLIPVDVKRALGVLASRLAWLRSSYYLECRLGQSYTPQVDLLAAITHDECDGAWQALAAGEPGVEAGLAAAAHLLRAWRDPSTPLCATVPVAWLEFDDVLEQARSANNTANVCVSLIQSYCDPFAELPAESSSRTHALAAAAVQLICGTQLDAEEQTQLEACFHHLPEHARWIHLSMMSQRAPAQLKLYGVFPRDALMQFLDNIRWRGNRHELSKVLDAYCHPDRIADEIYLDLPVRSARAPDTEIGLCFSQQQLRRARESDPSHRSLLAQLVRDELCTNTQAAALAAWPLPSCAGKAAQGVTLDRWVDIKLVCGRASGLSAKGYLGFSARAAAFGLGLATTALPAGAACAAPQVHR
jgi:hypothetical protein